LVFKVFLFYLTGCTVINNTKLKFVIYNIQIISWITKPGAEPSIFNLNLKNCHSSFTVDLKSDSLKYFFKTMNLILF